MPTPDPADWLLTDEESVEALRAQMSEPRLYRVVARAQLLKALKGVEEWLMGKRQEDESERDEALSHVAGQLAAARARLESEGKA